ncbi:MAG: RNA pseudouridine synthase [Saprospiraceae bacterium]|nr:MAG: RNA pseudouridine synthase [Saprospiraceae bacterium]
MSQNMPLLENRFIPFQESIESYSLPDRFTFPFYYDPHPLCLLAAKELEYYLENQTEWEHNFGIERDKKGPVIGKMFGVLVVQDQQNEIGYLAAFSGKLADKNHHPKFVPPVFDMLTKDGFFKKEEEILNELNHQIETLEKAPELLACQQFINAETTLASSRLQQQKQQMKVAKQARKVRRQQAKDTLTAEHFQALQEALVKESQQDKIYYKNLATYWKNRLSDAQQNLDQYLDEIAVLKKERKSKSAALQQKLFDQYQFLNQQGVIKSLCEIFQDKIPPAGSGECAAPKLLQYAFQHQLKPIAMAEFWWGQSPKSEIRKHGHFYPACWGKCEPILTHMLQGIEMDENPMLCNPGKEKVIEIIFEDDQLLVINKPAELLSVPGKNVQDSVFIRMQQKLPEATGPLIVHRLDMATSGLMLIAKTKEVHKNLQRQFIKRTIKKRYVALLDGIVTKEEGTIDLPLRVDLNDRPRQLVCYDFGKPAKTKWKVVEQSNHQTKIHFFPITGRTHQLRMHAAHALGLNTPILGDDLYGTKADRLHLHAESIEFVHPVSKEIMAIQVDPGF